MRTGVLATLLASLMLTATAATAAPDGGSVAGIGAELFFGGRALQGRIASHRTALPPDLTRCANCHSAGEGPAVERSIAPRLDREHLTGPRSRRGGPPSRYDAAAFCDLLRNGVDPVRIRVDQQMPRYLIDDADCMALWAFLSQQRP